MQTINALLGFHPKRVHELHRDQILSDLIGPSIAVSVFLSRSEHTRQCPLVVLCLRDRY